MMKTDHVWLLVFQLKDYHD
ncbi:unnamed protein product, partial [Rotaria socialis]